MTCYAAPFDVQNHRYVAAVGSLVEDGSFAIAERFGQTNVDFVTIGDRHLPNMPPGMVLALAPHYWVFSHIVGNALPHGSKIFAGLFAIWIAVTFTAPLMALAAVLLFRLLGHFTADEGVRVWLTLGWVFGTPLFAYGTSLWSHNLSATLVLSIFYLTVTAGPPAAIGALMGCLGLLENHAPVALAVLGSFWLWTTWTRARSLPSLAGAIALLAVAAAPFAAVLLAYNTREFGSPFTNAAAIWFAQYIPDTPVFAWPSLQRLWGMTFGLYRGVFVYAPLTLLGVIALARRPAANSLRWGAAYAAAFFLLCVTFVHWDGGVAFGPRYFSSAFLFLILAAAAWPRVTIRRWAIASIVINLAGATTNPTDNVLKNLAMMSYKAAVPDWVAFVRTDVWPGWHSTALAVGLPLLVLPALAATLWWLWSPRTGAA